MSFVFCFGGTLHAYVVEGTVAIGAPYPEPQQIAVKKDRETCGENQPSQEWIISKDGFLKNAVVSLSGDYEQSFETKKGTVLDQKGCRFEPHILLVRHDELYSIANSDPVAHDIRGFDGRNMLFQFESDEKEIRKAPGAAGDKRLVIRCGLHKWMHAYVVGARHAFYAVTDEAGRFRIEGIPAGEHLIKVWHERLGEVEIPLSLNADKSDFSYVFPAQKSA